MNSSDLIRMGIKNLWRRKLRTFLTVLGVIIGTASIIVMLSLGFAIKEAQQSQIAEMGSLTTINVRKRHDNFNNTKMGGQKKVKLDDKAIASFKQLPDVTTATPLIETYGYILNGKYITDTPIKGIEPEAMELLDFKIKEGRFLEGKDDLAIVFGGSMEHGFYDQKAMSRGRYVEPKINLMKDRMELTLDPNIGNMGMGSMHGGDNKKVNYKKYKIKTVGVLEEGNWETDWGIYAPLSTVQKMIKEKEKAENARPEAGRRRETGYEHVIVKVGDMKNVQTIQETIKEMGFEAYSHNDWLQEITKTTSIIQAVLGGIGAISLLVAAIGITNTMVMSIYERTKEIGIMKVIGASLRDIKRLFLFEAAVIGLLGGIIGVLFSEILSFILNKFGTHFMDFLGPGEGAKISIIPLWLIFAAMGFSTLIGIISGYYPAKRAMNLSALEAIRTE